MERYGFADAFKGRKVNHKRATIKQNQGSSQGMARLQSMSLAVVILACSCVASAVLTVLAWNVLAERRAIQCTDAAIGTYWESLETHRRAGDLVNPGWTWERLASVQRVYKVGFYGVWGLFAAAAFWGAAVWRRNREVWFPGRGVWDGGLG